VDANPLDEYRRLIADVYELAGRSRATSEAFARDTGQSAARWHLLSVVSDEPATVPTIARRLGLVRQSVQRVANELAEESLVEFHDNPANRRSPRVGITAYGRDVAARLFAESSRSRAQTLQRAGVTGAQLRAARQTLAAMNTALAELTDR